MAALPYAASSWIKVYQIGCLKKDVKVAVWISKSNHQVNTDEEANCILDMLDEAMWGHD